MNHRPAINLLLRLLTLSLIALGASACTTVPYGVSPAASSVYYVRDPWVDVSPQAQCYRRWNACYGGDYRVPPYSRNQAPGYRHQGPGYGHPPAYQRPVARPPHHRDPSNKPRPPHAGDHGHNHGAQRPDPRPPVSKPPPDHKPGHRAPTAVPRLRTPLSGASYGRPATPLPVVRAPQQRPTPTQAPRERAQHRDRDDRADQADRANRSDRSHRSDYGQHRQRRQR